MIDARGNAHRGKGAGGGQFADKHNSRPSASGMSAPTACLTRAEEDQILGAVATRLRAEMERGTETVHFDIAPDGEVTYFMNASRGWKWVGGKQASDETMVAMIEELKRLGPNLTERLSHTDEELWPNRYKLNVIDWSKRHAAIGS